MLNKSKSLVISEHSFWFILLGILAIYVRGLFITIMEIDAAQYASMSWEMLERNSFLQITDLYKDYLDKPPLLFWLSALSVKIFGVHSWSFKLPSFLIAIGSWYGLYKLTRHYYDVNIARFTVLIYASTIAILITLNDIRTDTILIAFVIFATWKLDEFFLKKDDKSLIMASIFLGLALLSKGPIGFMVPFLALVPHYVLTGRIKTLFNWRLLFLPIIILIVLSPMLYGLHLQFGWHGIRFFFWEQSFGRITGENVWENNAGYFFFVHTLAWAIIPWTLFLVKGFIKPSKKEYLSLFGIILPFIALSTSHYKLPHYIYIVIPFASIVIANAITNFVHSSSKFEIGLVKALQSIQIVGLLAGSVIVFYFFEPSLSFIVLASIVFLVLLAAFFVLKNSSTLITASLLVFIWVAFVINFHGYPNLLKYQSQSEVAYYLHDHSIPQEQFFVHGTWGRTLNFYSERIPPSYTKERWEDHQELYIFAKSDQVSFLSKDYDYEILQEFDHVNVTRLSIPFLNPKTREEHVEKRVLIKLIK